MTNLALAFGLLLAIGDVASAQENVLLIIADDLGIDQLGVYGTVGAAPTPAIDSLAAGGVRFRHAYATPLCNTSRAALMTGRHGFRTTVGDFNHALPDREFTIPEMLAATHRRAALGKWHLGGSSHPIDDVGFEYFAGLELDQAAVNNYFSWSKLIHDGATETTLENHDVYTTTDIVNEAIGRIQAFGSDPWFLWVAFTAVHSPLHVPPLGLLADPTIYDFTQPADKRKAMLEAMDTEIGRLLQNVPANTTVFFVGDNGSQIFQGCKSTLTECGLLVPFIIKRPNVPFPGTESTALVQLTDVFDTAAEIAGVAADAEDSESVLTYVADPGLPTVEREAPDGPYVYSELFAGFLTGDYLDGWRPQRAIRGERFKYYWHRMDPSGAVIEQLYDLSANPVEEYPFPGPDDLLGGPLTPEAEAALEDLRQAMHEALHDSDGDAVPYQLDNCTLVANPDRLDVNSDGFGNRCDPDVTDDGVVGIVDKIVMEAGCFGKTVGPGACSGAGGSCVHDPTCAESDVTGDGVVGVPDLLIAWPFWAKPPGPSGLACVTGTVICP